MGKEGGKDRHFTAEFKRNAVQLVTEKGMPIGLHRRDRDYYTSFLPEIQIDAFLLKALPAPDNLQCKKFDDFGKNYQDRVIGAS